MWTLFIVDDLIQMSKINLNNKIELIYYSNYSIIRISRVELIRYKTFVLLKFFNKRDLTNEKRIPRTKSLYEN